MSKETGLGQKLRLTTPLKWSLIFVTLGVTALILGLIFYLAGRFAYEEVGGSIEFDPPVMTSIAPEAGTISRLYVAENQVVNQDDKLFERSDPRAGRGDVGLRRSLQEGYDRSLDLIDQQRLLVSSQADQRTKEIEAQIEGLKGEIENLTAQVADTKRIADRTSDDFDRATKISERGFISRNELTDREVAAISAQQSVENLLLSIASKEQEVRALNARVSLVALDAQQQAATLEAQKIEIEARAETSNEASRSDVLAPGSGRVSVISIAEGEPVEKGDAVMRITPLEFRPRFVIFVPIDLAGGVTEGDDLKVELASFPSQQFGLVRGRVTSVSSAGLRRQVGSQGGQGMFVIVHLVLDLSDSEVPPNSLREGMTGTARIPRLRRFGISFL